MSCVMACDIDEPCQVAYEANFGRKPVGDIRKVESASVPDHDLLFAGFPCQPFSIIGGLQGFEDTRGTLFFEVARILESKRPKAFILENVKMLVGHQQGRTLGRIMKALRDIGYCSTFRVLNALDFGLPQKRERVLIVGFQEPVNFLWPEGGVPMKPLKEVLEKDVDRKYYASERIRDSRSKWHSAEKEPTIWHENKAGNVSKYPYSCALRAGASYNYLLVDGERRLTEREMLRLQGSPDSYKIVCNLGQTRKQAGNSVPVPVVEAVLDRVLDSLACSFPVRYPAPGSGQRELVMERRRVSDRAGTDSRPPCVASRPPCVGARPP
ncbi:MAG: DNA (cytosine-5-)-methyltransferase [Fimbriimonadaceae bacterium]|nr:DNA (cytosine-5-)-methyltransferase [Fimbriimonadaceae bacterium]